MPSHVFCEGTAGDDGVSSADAVLHEGFSVAVDDIVNDGVSDGPAGLEGGDTEQLHELGVVAEAEVVVVGGRSGEHADLALVAGLVGDDEREVLSGDSHDGRDDGGDDGGNGDVGHDVLLGVNFRRMVQV